MVNLASYACAVTAVVPLPFSDALLMLPIETAMVGAIGHIYGRKLGKARRKELLVELGTLAGASFIARQGIKAILPVFGAMLTIPAAFAANWAIGRVALAYFQDPELSREQLKVVYAQAKAEGAKIFSRERFVRFRGEEEKPAAKAKAPPAAPRKKPAVKKAKRPGEKRTR